MFSIMNLSPANASCSGTGKRMARIGSVARTVSVRHRISGRAMELIIGQESFSGAQQLWSCLNS